MAQFALVLDPQSSRQPLPVLLGKSCYNIGLQVKGTLKSFGHLAVERDGPKNMRSSPTVSRSRLSKYDTPGV